LVGDVEAWPYSTFNRWNSDGLSGGDGFSLEEIEAMEGE
jgi:hypothetical protein